MRRGKWDTKTKAMIVVEGLKGKPVGEICREYEVSQAQYYRWRDRFLTNMHQAFEDTNRREAALNSQIERLKRIIGELTIELKKDEEVWPG